MTVLNGIKTRLEAVTEHGMLPWRRVQQTDGAGTGVIDSAGSVIGYGTGIAAADLLANAPADLQRLVAALEAVSEVHSPIESGDERVVGYVCSECSAVDDQQYTFYPCTTIEALTAALGGDQ